ncbi:hypothetical protein LCGC14_0526020 [marine sediment metagenome]|uniref:Cell division protein FtsL n=1 Tax=marine sediment metagenome TaxID=412755 RepID=A0A0F9V578_9ZZZZ
MQHALRRPNIIRRPTPKSTARRKADEETSVVFKIIIFVLIILAAVALGRVVQFALYNQYALENEQLIKDIGSEQQIRQELVSRKLSLESPQRIQSIAMKKLKMIKPADVRYIVYKEVQDKPRLAYAQKNF